MTVMRTLPEDLPYLRTSLGLGTCICMKVRVRVGGEGGLWTHRTLESVTLVPKLLTKRVIN